MDATIFGLPASNFTGTSSQMKRNIGNALSEVKVLHGSPIKDKVALDEAYELLVKLHRLAIKFHQEMEEEAAKEVD